MSTTIWIPRLAPGARPVYRAIADALEADLEAGVLHPGARLPTHRQLAAALALSPLTVTRAYGEAARRGLVESTVGRGTFVRGSSPPLDPAGPGRKLVDLSRNILAACESLDLDGRSVAALRPVLREPEYGPAEGTLRHRVAAAAWLQRTGVTVPPERVVITPGAQQAILSIFAALCRPGDTVLAEELTYPRLVAIASLLHLKVEGVALDEHGLVPRALDRACREGRRKVLYCVPSFQNPTGSVMPEERRRELASIARRRSLTIVEDDVYGFLLDPGGPAPLAALAPDIACHVTSTSKSLTPALRLGFAALPEPLVEHVTSAFFAMTAFTSTFAAETFALLVESGAADEVVAAKRALIDRNRHAAERALGKEAITGHARSPHLWLTLPRACDARELAERARLRGIAVAPWSSFVAERSMVANAVRVSIGVSSDTAQMETVLRTLASLLTDSRLGASMVV